MSGRDDGGPAFPKLYAGMTYECNDGGRSTDFESTDGMSLRDYFAARAMQGILSGPASREGSHPGEWVGDVPLIAYQVADAMLRERFK